MDANNYQDYYIKNKLKLMEQFDKMLKQITPVLTENFEADKTEKLTREVRKEIELFLPQIPYIGGKKNKLTFNLVGSVYILALIKVLKEEGLKERDIGKLVYEMNEKYVKSQSHFLKWLYPKLVFSKFMMKKAKKSAEESQLKKYEGDWVKEFVKGNGDDFDYGITYTECGIFKFYKKMGYEQYIPYLCLTDYAMFREFGIGMKRTQTIGNGAPICDFRFKKGEQTQLGWPPEEIEEFKLNEKSS